MSRSARACALVLAAVLVPACGAARSTEPRAASEAEAGAEETTPAGRSRPIIRAAGEVDACMGASVRPVLRGLASALEDRAAFVCACAPAGTPEGSATTALYLEASAGTLRSALSAAHGPRDVTACIEERVGAVAHAWLEVLSEAGIHWSAPDPEMREQWDFEGIDCSAVARDPAASALLSNEWTAAHPGGVADPLELPGATCPLTPTLVVGWAVRWGP